MGDTNAHTIGQALTLNKDDVMFIPLELWILFGIVFVGFILALLWARRQAVTIPPGVEKKTPPAISKTDDSAAMPEWIIDLGAAGRDVAGRPVFPSQPAKRGSGTKAVGCGLSLLFGMLACGIVFALYFILFAPVR